MSNLFSSPSKQAQAAASATGAEAQQTLQQYENYVTQQQGQLRGAISGLGENPYFGAAAEMSPSAYKVDPAYATSFGQSSLPPGLSQGAPSQQTSGNPFAPPSQQRSTQPTQRSVNTPDAGPPPQQQAQQQIAQSNAASPPPRADGLTLNAQGLGHDYQMGTDQWGRPTTVGTNQQVFTELPGVNGQEPIWTMNAPPGTGQAPVQPPTPANPFAPGAGSQPHVTPNRRAVM